MSLYVEVSAAATASDLRLRPPRRLSLASFVALFVAPICERCAGGGGVVLQTAPPFGVFVVGAAAISHTWMGLIAAACRWA